MPLKLTINEDLKKYMKDKDTYALEALRMLKSEVKNAEIEHKKEFDDDDIVKILQSSIKKNKEAAEIYEKAGRADLRDKENRYTEVLSKYLPEQFDSAKIKEIIISVINGMGDIDPKTSFGVVMKAAMLKIGVRAEGKMVSAAVKEILDGIN
ncbi:MAG: GatB/YqeY domain-containing protein [Deferribacteraceae bacterium]|jgi:uncharacterized protein YqeY|nr:GatB/YqeY domain-containing protein [Deferribacteraceae bacterium]